MQWHKNEVTREVTVQNNMTEAKILAQGYAVYIPRVPPKWTPLETAVVFGQ